MDIVLTKGDLLKQDVEFIVNPWNRNFIPWWLLLPQGVSGAIKRRGGTKPFRELRKHGALDLGQAVCTTAGNLPFKAIIHVAGIGHNWRSSQSSIVRSVNSSLNIAIENDFRSVAYPLIGSGTGEGKPRKVTELILDEVKDSQYSGRTVIVEYSKSRQEI